MIEERAMLAAVHIHLWEAVKYDKRASDEVAARHGAQGNAGRYNKRLLQGAEKLEAIRTLAGQVRQHFYKRTLPWSDEGYRILPAHLYFDLAEAMRGFDDRFRTAVDAFIAAYPGYVEKMRPALNGLFREEDYQDPRVVRSKFSLKLEILPFPSGEDFRVNLSKEQRARLVEEIDQNVRESLARGTRELWMRLRKVIAHMVERLGDPQARLHASIVDNVVELVELLPRLNVGNDPQLYAFAEEVRTRLCSYSAQDLRKNSDLRLEAAQEAAAIVERISTVLDNEEEVLSPFGPSATQTVLDRMSAFMGNPAA